MLINPLLTSLALDREACLLHRKASKSPSPGHTQVTPTTYKANGVAASRTGPPTPTRLIFCSWFRIRATELHGHHTVGEANPSSLLWEKKPSLESPCAKNTTPSARKSPSKEKPASPSPTGKQSQPCFDEILTFHLTHLLQKRKRCTGRKSGMDLLAPLYL